MTLVHRGDEILRGFDDDVRRHLRSEMVGRGLKSFSGKRSADRERPLDAGDSRTTGFVHRAGDVRDRPARQHQGHGTRSVGVEIVRDRRGQGRQILALTVPSIYAIGDVTNRLALTPVAIREGHAFADTVFGNKPTQADHENVPSAVFSEPEIGVVGLSETKAREKGFALDIYREQFRPMKATLSGRATSMLMKLVVDRASERVLGVHIVGEAAAEMVQLAAIAVKMGAKKSDFDATVALHPTAAEELVTLHNKM